MADASTTDAPVVTPGVKTSEFWGMLLALLVPQLPMLVGIAGPRTDAWVQIGLAVASALGSGAYSISRSNVKSAAINASAYGRA